MPSLPQEILDQILYRAVDTVEDDCSYLDRHKDWSRAYLTNQAFDFRRVCLELEEHFRHFVLKTRTSHVTIAAPSRKFQSCQRAEIPNATMSVHPLSIKHGTSLDIKPCHARKEQEVIKMTASVCSLLGACKTVKHVRFTIFYHDSALRDRSPSAYFELLSTAWDLKREILIMHGLQKSRMSRKRRFTWQFVRLPASIDYYDPATSNVARFRERLIREELLEKFPQLGIT